MKTKYLYFWNNDINLGDYASLYVANKISQEKIVYKNPFICIINIFYNVLKFIIGKRSNTLDYLKHYLFPWQKIIFGIGSILDFATKNCIIWGSGFREYNSKTSCKNIVAVRGYKTLNLLPPPINKDKIAIGDPALLLPLVFSPNKIGDNHISIIPHYKEISLMSNLNQNNYNLIDIRTDNIEEFVTKLNSSKYILSSSLHGLIIAHAYNIKALWIKYGNVGSSDFKYFDYFSSVNINNYPNLEAEDILNLDPSEIERLFLKYDKQSLPQIDLKNIQFNLLKCAPFKLKPNLI